MSRIVLILSLLVCFCNAPLWAEDGQDPRSIYVVDMQRAIDESEMGKAAKLRVDSEIKKEETSLQKLRTDIDRLKSDLMKQSSLLSPEAASEKKVQIEGKVAELKTSFEQKKESLARKNAAEIEKIVREIDKVVQDLARKNSYGFVIEKDTRYVLFVKDKYDLTPEVIEALNRIRKDTEE